MEGCLGSWNLGLVIHPEAMRDSKGRPAVTWKVSTSGQPNTSSSGRGNLTSSGRRERADCIHKKGSAVFRGPHLHWNLLIYSHSNFQGPVPSQSLL